MSDPAFSTSNGTDRIDVSLLEKRLEGLRDTQESVQGLSLWCQSNKRHASTITDTWLRVLRKSPVEKRLTMFYLANDVVQHAKRKSDGIVLNQWALAIQKATPHVRSPASVSLAITRIFKIWEERVIYSKEAVADLLVLLGNVSSKEKVENQNPETYTANAEKVSAFQPSTLITNFKLASRLKPHLGTTFRTKSYCVMDLETLKNSIKDRQHGQEVIQEMGALLEQLRTSEQKLQAEVEERRKIVETTEIAIVFYENVRSESEIVNSAYKSFTARIMKAKEAVDSKLQSFEDMEREPSPCPSPPTAAPSPPEDDDEEYVPLDVTSTMPVSSGFNCGDNSKVPPSISLSSDSGMSLQDARTISSTISTMAPTIPIINNPVVTNIPQMNYHNSQAYDPHLGMTMQHQSWPTVNEDFASIMMNFQQNMPLPQMMQASVPPNFSITPSMHLQMQMQQNHIQQQYGYLAPSPGMNFDITDVSSIPLPPQNPDLGKPPLPSQHEIMFKQYPPLPPKH